MEEGYSSLNPPDFKSKALRNQTGAAAQLPEALMGMLHTERVVV